MLDPFANVTQMTEAINGTDEHGNDRRKTTAKRIKVPLVNIT